MGRCVAGTTSRAFTILVRGAGATCLTATWASATLASAMLPARALARGDAVVQRMVRNAVTVAPVENATVRIVGTYRARTTGADGRYRFTLAPGSIELRVTAIGFAPAAQTISLAPAGVVTADFSLHPAAVSLDEVVTTGTRTTGTRTTGTRTTERTRSHHPAWLRATGSVAVSRAACR